MVGLDTYGVVGNGKRLGDLGDEFRDLSEPNFVMNWREQLRPNVDTPPASRASPQQQHHYLKQMALGRAR